MRSAVEQVANRIVHKETQFKCHYEFCKFVVLTLMHRRAGNDMKPSNNPKIRDQAARESPVGADQNPHD